MTTEIQASPLRLADYYVWNTIMEVALSPDGSKAVYVQRGTRKAKNDHYTNLWLVTTDGSRAPYRLTRTLSRDSSPAFSRDGRYLAFLSTREDELEVAETRTTDTKAGKANGDKPKTQVWLFDLKYGGEPRQITTMAEGVAGFDWAPDGSRLVVAARTPTPAQEAYLKSLRGEEKGPYQLRRLQHKRDGQGFLDEVCTHLHVVDVTSRATKQLTDGPCNETDPRWSPDGRWIAFASNRTGNADANRRSDLWLISPEGDGAARLTFGDVSAYGGRWSPDSARIAFVSSTDPENACKVQQVMVVDVAAAAPVADLGACVGEGWSAIGGVVPDLTPEWSGPVVANARRYPVPTGRTQTRVLTDGLDRTMLGMPVWLDEQSLLINAGDRGQTRLLRVDLNGKTAFLFPTDRCHEALFFEVQAGRLVLDIDSPQTGPDLYTLPVKDLGTANPVKLTAINDSLLAQRTLAPYERFEFTGSLGDPVEALVAVPPSWTPAAGPAPVIVSIHGGPMTYDAARFSFLVQYWAGMGYLVLMVNYHGSISYGEAFTESIRGKWGPTEHADLEAGLDALIARGWADPNRSFVTGFSQGGIMTNWAVGHTDRFRAAVSEHGMWNYLMSFGTDDCQLWWQDDFGVPWQNADAFRASSPYSSLDRIKTPTLIMAGEDDWRCPLVESEQMYIGLKKRGVPTELIVWQNEHHALSRPRRMIDRMRRICNWFAGYGGVAVADDSAEGYPDLV